MNITQISDQLDNLLRKLEETKGTTEFIYDLLLTYGIPNASIARLKKGGLNLSKIEGEVDMKSKVFFKAVTPDEDPREVMATLLSNGRAIKHAPRFVIVTDFVSFLAQDMKIQESLDIPLTQLVQHYDFFLPWAGMEKATHQ
jgi:hypothetical protein